MRHNIRQVQNRSILLPLLRLTPQRRGFLVTSFVEFCVEVRGWPAYTAVKKYYRKLQPPEYGARKLQTDRQRDGIRVFGVECLSK